MAECPALHSCLDTEHRCELQRVVPLGQAVTQSQEGPERPVFMIISFYRHGN